MPAVVYFALLGLVDGVWVGTACHTSPAAPLGIPGISPSPGTTAASIPAPYAFAVAQGSG